MPERETRTFALDSIKIERRADDPDGVPVRIVGHAAVFNQLSEDFGGWRERIAPGAFSEALGDDVRALFNHNPDWLLGRTRSKTLRLDQDRTGLAIDIAPPDTQLVRDLVLAPMDRGDLSQMSFAFSGAESAWEETPDGIVRTIVKVSRLWDVSPVTYPAYAQTEVGMREFRAQAARRVLVPGGGFRRRKTQQAIEALTVVDRAKLATT